MEIVALILGAVSAALLVVLFVLRARRGVYELPVYVLPEHEFVVSIASSCPHTPGPAGWAWVSSGRVWAAGSMPDAARAEAALRAMAEALETHTRTEGLVIRTTSQYAHDALTRHVDEWARRGWVTTSGEPIKHRLLAERLLAARNARRAAGIPDALVLIAPDHTGHPTGEWAKVCANRALRHARNGSRRTWTAGDGTFDVDLSRRPRKYDRAAA